MRTVLKKAILAREPETVSLASAAPGYDQNAVATASVCRLDDETVSMLDELYKLSDLALILDDAVKVGNGHTRLERKFLGQCLVVNARVQAARIHAHDVLGIAFIEAEHAGFTQFFRDAEHYPPVNDLKRVSSSSR